MHPFFKNLEQFSVYGIRLCLTYGLQWTITNLNFAYFNRESQISICFRISKELIFSSPLKYDNLNRKIRYLPFFFCGFCTNLRAEKSAI